MFVLIILSFRRVLKYEHFPLTEPFFSQPLSPETENQNKNEHMDWISLNVLVVEENIHATIRIHMQEATINIDESECISI